MTEAEETHRGGGDQEIIKIHPFQLRADTNPISGIPIRWQ